MVPAAAAIDLAELGRQIPTLAAVPFALVLLSIAVLPVAAPRVWHDHYPKIVTALALAFVIPFLAAYGEAAFDALVHVLLLDYVPFIVLVGGLFVVSGGLVVRGRLAGTPEANTALLAVGTLIASAIGTTGASMLLIRPLLRANASRRSKEHLVVFFIFLVSNIGGCLTPLGDPPLFLGFLAGVPFAWTLRLAPQLGLLAGVLLPVFWLVDRAALAREGGRASLPRAPAAPLRLAGKVNLVFLAGIVGAVLLSGIWDGGEVLVLGAPLKVEALVRDAVILACAAASLALTPRGLRGENEFSWEPIREVGILFFGIFVTIVPLLAFLKLGEDGPLGALFRSVSEPWQYFWATGILSSFLDNAPTYLTMLNSQIERFHPGAPEFRAAAMLASEQTRYLAAVAAGAVFMGANTYIGNAPNFMVKAIAERSGVRMPSFFGYQLRWSLPILVPLFVVLTLVFFR